MRYFNSSENKNYYMPIIGEEPNIIDNNTSSEREIKIECVRFFVNNEIVKNINDKFIIRHRPSNEKDFENWFTAVSAKTVRGFTTFKTIKACREKPISMTPSIISGSWEYDGESERFEIPLLSPIYSNDNITCYLSNKTSDKNDLTIRPLAGIIEVSRKV